ncbi:venom carboxylesterase-6-like [Lycorma delicatula]|uniref:venom carboxylesterase-6-like n=1 Tax=Lycorma delicatula TaxID=130591 RepID=UPI003F51359B
MPNNNFQILIYLLFLLFIKLIICDEKLPHISTPYGDIKGTYLKTPDDKFYEAYLGVPYAKPPVGDLRFKEPQKLPEWIGTYNATSYGSDCLQFSHFGYDVVGSEDCLFLNIYKPSTSIKDGSLYDVVVHIHGGAFMFFAARGFTPDKLMNHDIVFVSFNYRLGPLGFMSTGDKILPGNLGLKDQAFALKWIKKNIKYFSGDPNKITITGVSAGGVSVHYHYLSPISRGLFNKGISSSGAVLNPWALAEDVPLKTKIIATRLGCPTSDSNIMIKCLNRRPAEQIASQVPLFLGWLYSPFTPFGPVVEPEDAESPFIPRNPYDMIKDGDFAKLPWLASFTTEEGLYPASEFVDNPELLKELEKNWYSYAPHLLDYNYTVPLDKKNYITDIITKYYLKDKKITEGVKELIQLVGDRIFGSGIVQSALMQAAVSDEEKAPVYLYRFGYRGKYSASQAFSHTETDFGVCHADDSGYILNSEILKMDQTQNDRDMSKRMINIWLSFVKTGKPEFFNNEQIPTVLENGNKIRYLEILSYDKAFPVVRNDLAGLNFWSSLSDIKEKLKLPFNIRQVQDEL